MFEKRSCNMKAKESYLRAFIATLMLIYATLNNSIIFSIMSVALYYTAFTKFCFTYYFFKINEKYSLKNYYLSLLPRHRPSPVFIFDTNGKILFKNSTAENELSHINSTDDIGLKKFKHIISQDALRTVFLSMMKSFTK